METTIEYCPGCFIPIKIDGNILHLGEKKLNLKELINWIDSDDLKSYADSIDYAVLSISELMSVFINSKVNENCYVLNHADIGTLFELSFHLKKMTEVTKHNTL